MKSILFLTLFVSLSAYAEEASKIEIEPSKDCKKVLECEKTVDGRCTQVVVSFQGKCQLKALNVSSIE